MTEASPITHKETPFPQEIVLPTEIRGPLIDGSTQALANIIELDKDSNGYVVKEDAPDIVIIPLRSARLTAEPVRTFLEKHQGQIAGDLPVFLESPIGKVIPASYIDSLDSKGVDADDAEELNIGDVLDDFNTWVADPDNTVTQPIITDIRNANKKRDKEVSRVLVLDDAVGHIVDANQGTGETLTYTAPAILKAALGESITISTQAVLPDNAGAWEYSIVDENFPGIESKATRFFMHELMKGTLDARTLQREGQFIPNQSERKWLLDTLDEKQSEKGYPILTISDRDTLRMLEHLTWQFNQSEKRFSIVEKLEEQYGLENLLELPQLTKKSFESTASEIKIN